MQILSFFEAEQRLNADQKHLKQRTGPLLFNTENQTDEVDHLRIQILRISA